jgi:hypothetical protein
MHVCGVFADTTVHSLDGVKGAMKTTEGRRLFDSEMSDAPQPDRFGTTLAAGFTDALLLASLAPDANPNRLSLSGVRAWPAKPGFYVAMVCLRAASFSGPAKKDGNGDGCNTVDNAEDKNTVRFGVFKKDGDTVPVLIARSDDDANLVLDWHVGGIDEPVSVDDAGHADNQTWTGFDLAPYRLRDDDYAFGVRLTSSEGYAGGGATFEGLFLFHIDGQHLMPVFSSGMAFSKMLAGDWNKDGTRQHDVSDGSNALLLLPTKTDGFYDIQLRRQKSKWRQTYRWDKSKQAYR